MLTRWLLWPSTEYGQLKKTVTAPTPYQELSVP